MKMAGQRWTGALAAVALVGMVSIVSTAADSNTVAAADLEVCPSGCSFASINSALASAESGDTINVGVGTYTESIVVPAALTSITLSGAGVADTVLDGENARRLLTVRPGQTVMLEQLTFSAGRGVRDGGVIGTGNGGAISNEGSLTLRNVTIRDSIGEDRGGGIWNPGGTVLIEDSDFLNNASGDPNQSGFRGLGGGAIASSGTGSSVTIRRSQFIDNVAVEPTTDFRGGGAINSSNGDVEIEDSLVSGNTAGYSSGAIDFRGSGSQLIIRRSRFTNNSAQLGGALQVRSGGVAVIDASTFDANAASNAYGAMRLDGSNATITNSTISGNSAVRSTGGVSFSGGNLNLAGVSIVGNSAENIGGLLSNGSRSVAADHVVIAGNTDTGGYADCLGPIVATGALFVGDTTGCDPTAGTLLSGDPLLGPLGDNGGPTPTHLPGDGSPLLDAGATTLTIDQRGLARPSGTSADLGSVEVQVVSDTSPPTFGPGALTATELTPTSVRLTWPAATDDVGIVTGYIVSDGTTDLATSPATDTTTVLTGLSPETAYRFDVQATDDAGNTSVDGPQTDVTTPAVPPSGHIGPGAADGDLTWTNTLPFALFSQAGQASKITVVASSGSFPQVRADIDPFGAERLDLDGDLIDDIEVTALPNQSPLGPALDLAVTRLTTPGPADVEVLGAFNLGTTFGSSLPATLVNGFRTLDAAGGVGGTLPDSETLRFATGAIIGLNHEIQFGYDTVGPTGQMLFIGGIVEGDGRAGSGAANVVTMQVDQIPDTVATTLRFNSTDVGDPAAAGLEAGLEWLSTPANVRPRVTFAYGEREARTKLPAEHQLTATIDAIAPQQRLRLNVDSAPDRGGDQGSITFEGATPTTPVGEVSVEHRRSDGLVLRGGLLNLTDDFVMSVDALGALNLDDGRSPQTRLFFEMHQPGHDFFGGAFSQPISTVFASLRDRRSTTVVDAAASATGDISIRADGGEGELVVLASSNIAAPALDTLAVGWPITHPQNWSYGRPSAFGGGFLRVGLVDDGATSTLAIHANAYELIELDLDPDTLSQLASIESTDQSELDVEANLGPGTALGGPDGTTMRCTAFTRGGLVGLTIEPPTTYGLAADRYLYDVDCWGERGDVEATMVAERLPATTTIDLVDVQSTTGAFLITTPETGDWRHVDGLEIAVTDPSGILPDGVLGVPATYVQLHGTSIPSARVEWESAATTSVTVESLHPEDPVGQLGAIIASEQPVFAEGRPETPDSFLTDAPDGRADQAWFAMWDTGFFQLLGGRAVKASSVDLTHQPGDGGVDVITEQRDGASLVAEILSDAGGHFTPNIGLNGGCAVELPIGVNTFDLQPDERITWTGDNPMVSSFRAISCAMSFADGALGPDATVRLTADELPTGLTITHRPDQASIRTNGGPSGEITLTLTDRSPSGLAGQQLLGQPLKRVGLLLGEVTVADVSWNVTGGVTTAVVDTFGQPAGRVGLRASTNFPQPWAPPGNHWIDVDIDDNAESTSFVIQFDEVDRAEFELFSGDVPRLTIDLETKRPRPLTMEIDSDGLTAYDIDATVADVPSEFLLVTDLKTSIETTASTAIQSAELHSITGIGPPNDDRASPDYGKRPINRALHVELSEIPATLDVDLDNILIVGGLAAVTVGGRLGAIDAVARTDEPGGVQGSGADRLRLLIEDLPSDILVVADADPATGHVSVHGRTSSAVDRVLVELTSNSGVLGLDYRRVFAQLVDLPPEWFINVTPDAGDVSARFEFQDDIVGPAPTVSDAVGRVEFVASKGFISDLSTYDQGAFLETFAQAGSAVVTRSALVKSLDDGYWSASTARSLNDLYGVGMPLPTGQVAVGFAPDGVGGQLRTVALQDHLVLNQLGDKGPSDVSFALSQVHRGELTNAGGHAEMTLVRPTTFSGGGLYVGMSETTWASYSDGVRASDLAKNLPSAPEEAPSVPDSETRALEWRNPHTLELAYTGGSLGWSGITSPRGLIREVVGQSSGATATVVRVDGTNPSGVLVLRDWNGVDFANGETLVVQDDDGGDPLTAVADVAARFAGTWGVRGIGSFGGDPSTFSIVRQPTRGQAFLDGNTIRYTPNDLSQVGNDAFVYELCNDGGLCKRGALGVMHSEFYTNLLTLQFVDQPTSLTVTIEPDFDVGAASPGVGAITIEAPEALGSFEFYDGPEGQLTTEPLVDYLRVRGDADGTRLTVDLSDINEFLPGRLLIDSDDVIELIGVSGTRGGDRLVFGLSGFELNVQTMLDGLLVDDEENDLAEYEGAGECDDIIDLGCWLLFRIGVVASGDGPGGGLDGFFATYDAIEIDPSRGGGVDAVPRFTAEFERLEFVLARFEAELDLLCGATCNLIPPLDLETALLPIIRGLRLAFWDQGLDVCLPALDALADDDDWDGCIEVDGPDYLDADPWDFSIGQPVTFGTRVPIVPADAQRLDLADTTLVPGQDISIVLPAGTTSYQIMLFSTPRILAADTGAGGDVIDVTIPSDMEPGDHTLALFVLADGEGATYAADVTIGAEVPPTTPPTVDTTPPTVDTTPVTIDTTPQPTSPERPSPSTLPRTGSSTAPMTSAAIVLVLAGMLLLLVRRHPRRAA